MAKHFVTLRDEHGEPCMIRAATVVGVYRHRDGKGNALKTMKIETKDSSYIVQGKLEEIVAAVEKHLYPTK